MFFVMTIWTKELQITSTIVLTIPIFVVYLKYLGVAVRATFARTPTFA